MKLSDGRKVAMHKTPVCEERNRLHTELSQLLANWHAASDELKQTSRSDSSRESKVAEVKKSKAKLDAAESHYSIHVREHGCW
jgi:hypothetical protein